MKDFQDVIQASEQLDGHIKQQIGQPKSAPPQVPLSETITSQVLPLISPFLLSIVTGPFSTVSAFLQTTSPGITSAGVASKLKAQPNLSQHILNGIFGDNKMYTPPSLQGYRDALARLGKEGIRGVYKGNLAAVLLAASNASLRSYLYGVGAHREGLDVISQNLISIHLKKQASNRKLFTRRLHHSPVDDRPIEARPSEQLVSLQKQLTVYQAYGSLLSVFTRTSPSLLFSGGSLLLFKNILFDLSWVKIMPESPVHSFIISSTLCHLLTYPFLTVMRQMQVNDPKTSMMQSRIEKVRECIRRMRQEGGVKSFYRGFLAYGVVHLFMGGLMVQVNMRSGYFLNEPEQ